MRISLPRSALAGSVGSLVVVVALLFGPANASAQRAPLSGTTQKPPRGDHRIDPRIAALIAHRARFGETFPVFKRSQRFEREGVFPVVVRFASRATEAALRVRRPALEVLAPRQFWFITRRPCPRYPS